jgi:hypothetical protein
MDTDTEGMDRNDDLVGVRGRRRDLGTFDILIRRIGTDISLHRASSHRG